MRRHQQWTSSNHRYGLSKAKRNYGDLGIVLNRNSKTGHKKRHEESSGTDFPEDLNASFNEGTFPIHQKSMANVKYNISTPQKIHRKTRAYNFLLPTKKHSGIQNSEFEFEAFGKTYGRTHNNITCFENRISATGADQKVPNSEALYKELAEELFGCESEFESFHNDDGNNTLINDCHLNTNQQWHISKELEYEFNLSFNENAEGETDSQKEDVKVLTTHHSATAEEDNQLRKECIGQALTTSSERLRKEPAGWLHAEKPGKAMFKTYAEDTEVAVSDAETVNSKGCYKQYQNATDALFKDNDINTLKDALTNNSVSATSNLNESLSVIPYQKAPVNLKEDSALLMPVQELLDNDDFVPSSQTEHNASALSRISRRFDSNINRNMKYHSEPHTVLSVEQEPCVEDATLFEIENIGIGTNYSEDIVPGSQSQHETSKFIAGKEIFFNIARPVVSKSEHFNTQSQGKGNTGARPTLQFAQNCEIITKCTNEVVSEFKEEKTTSDGYLGKEKTARSEHSLAVQGERAQNVQLIDTDDDLSDGFIPPSQPSQLNGLHQNIPELAVFLSSSKAVSERYSTHPKKIPQHKPARTSFQLL